jgi:hypothetical protein
MFYFRKKTVEIIALLPPRLAYVEKFNPITFIDDSFPEKGLVLPLWCDYFYKTEHHGSRAAVADGISRTKQHNQSQTGNNFYSDYFHYKIDSPWFINCKIPIIYQPVNFLDVRDQNNNLVNSKDIIILPGRMPRADFNFVNPSNVFCLLKRPNYGEEAKTFCIKAGTPLIHIIPVTEDKIVFRTEVASKADFERLVDYNRPCVHFTASKLKQDNTARTLAKKNYK